MRAQVHTYEDIFFCDASFVFISYLLEILEMVFVHEEFSNKACPSIRCWVVTHGQCYSNMCMFCEYCICNLR